MIIIIIHSHACFLVMKNDTIICNLTLRLLFEYIFVTKKRKTRKERKEKSAPEEKHLWNYQKRLISLFFFLSAESFQTWWIFFMRTKNEMLSRQQKKKNSTNQKKKKVIRKKLFHVGLRQRKENLANELIFRVWEKIKTNNMMHAKLYIQFISICFAFHNFKFISGC